jgi:hypothetical protein
MGIQSKRNNSKKNNIIVNINIEEEQKPIVVKQPKPIVVKQAKPVIVNQPKQTPVIKINPAITDLKKNAEKFQKLRDDALSKGVNLPQNFSSIPDIRNQNDLSKVNKSLLDKIKLLEEKLKNVVVPTTPVVPTIPVVPGPVDYVSLSKFLVFEVDKMIKEQAPTEVINQTIVDSIKKIKNYINLEDDPAKDEQMNRYIEHLANRWYQAVPDPNTGVSPLDPEPDPDDVTPDLPEIVQFPNTLPEDLLILLRSSPPIKEDIDANLRKNVSNQLISEKTKETIQKMRNISLIPKPVAGAGPSRIALGVFIDKYIPPNKKAVLEPLREGGRGEIKVLGSDWNRVSLLSTLVLQLILNPELKLTPRIYKPAIAELDTRISKLREYITNINNYRNEYNPEISVKRKLRALQSKIDGSIRNLKISYLDDDEDNEKAIRESFNRLDNTGGSVNAFIAFTLDNDDAMITPDSVIKLFEDTEFSQARPNLPKASNLAITDGDDGQTRLILGEPTGDGIDRPRLFNDDGTLYTTVIPVETPPVDPDFNEGQTPEQEVIPIDEDIENEYIFDLVQKLFYTKRGNDDAVQSLYFELSRAYNTPDDKFTTLTLTQGNIALAKALIKTGIEVNDNSVVSFEGAPTNRGGALPRFKLIVDGKPVKKGTETWYFTGLGDEYSSKDLERQTPEITYPYKDLQKDEF